MHSDDDTPVTKQEDSNDTLPENVTVSLDKIETPKKADVEDPKPRIVLTFRSEKSGTKSSNMKIVSSEEKHEEISPRRSIRTRNSKKDSDEDNVSQIDSDDEEIIEIPSTTKRSTRRRSKEYCDVIANAIARKIKSYNEPSSAPTQRLSRRTKPTAKVLANQELRMAPESQNARLGIATDKPVEEGVRTRRSAQAKNTEPQSEKKLSKRKVQEESANESSDKESDYSSKKLIHLCNLGLKVKDEESSEADNRKTESSANEGPDEDEEIDDDTEVISKLLEADEESASDEDFCPDTAIKKRRSKRNSSPAPLRRSSRKANSGLYYYDPFTVDDPEDSDYEPKRKSSRSHGGDEGAQSDPEMKTKDGSDAAPAEEEGSEAACPSDKSVIVATCLCEETSNIYAAPSELTEPVFCQAIEVVEGVRVGCSHAAARDAGALRALRRAGPRAPYFLACRLHAAQLARHMCCPACGLFCTQGIFNQCSKGHLFHLECAIQGYEKQKTGCPHCGVHSYRWQPVNQEYSRVQVDMHCSNQRVFLPDQREQSTMAVLGFSSLEPSQLDVGPLIPEDLLPSMPLDLKKLFETESEDDSDYSIDSLYEAIMAGESVEQLIPKIVRGPRLDTPLRACAGGTLAHAAARRAALPALCLLRHAGADLDARDRAARTPLLVALLALVDKETTDEGDNEVIEAETTTKKEETTEESEVTIDVKKEEDEEGKTEIKEEEEHQEDVHKPSKEDLLKVIKFLIAADCDLNKQGPEGMTALHVAAQHGAGAAARALLAAGARRDARDAGGWTPLVRAAENGHDDIVRLLLSQGAEAVARDAEGNLPLHWCALAGRARALALLLRAAPAARDAPNAHADTPLHIAAREDHYACVMVLLAHGARTDLENSAGELAVEVCTDRCHAAILLNMQMTLAVKGNMPRARILSSDISNGREPFPVACVNEVDDAPLPDDFTYVSQMVAPEHVPVDDSIQTMQGCSCTDECGEECACCTLGVRRWYRGGRLPAAFPYHDPPMLFECNQTCKCNMKRCSNRVVGAAEARGSLARAAQVYRTAAAGWGLRAAAAAPRGALLALYRGELLPRARADARPDDQYMFALDIKPDLLEQCSDQSELCVDASRYGSAARFMNHSCRPTAAAVRVFTSARDLRRPHVAFFALRDLPAFTPLTFDYGDKFWSVKSRFMKCECESPDCRYPTKATETNDS